MPVTIGPFDNVPAPGDPITSAWPQEISTYVNALPRGLIAQQLITTPQSLAAGAAWVDIAGLYVVWNAVTGRMYQITLRCSFKKTTAAGDIFLGLYQGASQIDGAGQTIQVVNGIATLNVVRHISGLGTGSVTHNGKMFASTNGIDTVSSAQYPALISVEDYGPVSGLPTLLPADDATDARDLGLPAGPPLTDADLELDEVDA